MKLSIKTRIKFLKAQFVVFMTRKRYVGSYPQLKRFVLVNFLFLVIGFVGWNVTLNLPRIEIAWPDGRITVEQPVHAKFEASEAIVEVKEVVKERDLADYIWFKESTRGKNNYSKCEAIGKINGIGYAIPGDGSYICFDSHEDEMVALNGWLMAKKAAGWSELKMLCTYSGQNYSECKN